MKRLITLGFFYFVGTCFGLITFPEDTATHTITMQVADVCVLDITGASGKLIVTPPRAKNAPTQEGMDSSTYLQYTSATARDRYRSISVRWGAFDTPPSGCKLSVKAKPSGRLNEGQSTGEITLSPTPQIIIQDVGSCATGTGFQDGARLFYRLSLTDAGQVTHKEAKTATLLFTLTDTF